MSSLEQVEKIYTTASNTTSRNEDMFRNEALMENSTSYTPKINVEYSKDYANNVNTSIFVVSEKFGSYSNAIELGC